MARRRRSGGWVAAGWVVGLWLLQPQAMAAAERPVTASLIAESSTVGPGDPNWVGVHLVMAAGWHTYWKNPGDSGLPTTVTWEMPGGFQVGPIQWPSPRRLEAPFGVNFGYEGDVLLLAKVQGPATVTSGQEVQVRARVDWVACKDICVKGGAELDATWVVGEPLVPDARWVNAFQRARARLPRPAAGWALAARDHGTMLILEVAQPSGDLPTHVELMFFPEEPGVVEPSAPQRHPRRVFRGPDRLLLTPSSFLTARPERLRGVLVVRQGGQDQAVAVDVPVSSGDARGTPALREGG